MADASSVRLARMNANARYDMRGQLMAADGNQPAALHPHSMDMHALAHPVI